MSLELSAGWWLTTHGGVELLRWSNEAEMHVTDDGLGWFAASGQGMGNRIGTTLARKLEMPACIVEGTARGYIDWDRGENVRGKSWGEMDAAEKTGGWRQ